MKTIILNVALIFLLAIVLTLIIGYMQLYINQKGEMSLERQVERNRLECEIEKKKAHEGLYLGCLPEVWAAPGGFPFPFICSSYGLCPTGGFNTIFFALDVFLVTLVLAISRVIFWFVWNKK